MKCEHTTFKTLTTNMYTCSNENNLKLKENLNENTQKTLYLTPICFLSYHFRASFSNFFEGKQLFSKTKHPSNRHNKSWHKYE